MFVIYLCGDGSAVCDEKETQIKCLWCLVFHIILLFLESRRTNKLCILYTYLCIIIFHMPLIMFTPSGEVIVQQSRKTLLVELAGLHNEQ